MTTDWRAVVLVGLSGMVLAGCNFGSSGKATADDALADAGTGSATGSDTLTPNTGKSSPQNMAPVINGSPQTSATAGTPYSFTPAATDPDSGTVTFLITGKPSWASFSTATGQLSGTPNYSHVGSYANIVITATDGFASSKLPAFNIEVRPASVASTTGSAVLSWLPPTENSDGTPATALGGYRIYHGASEGALVRVAQIANAGITTHVFDALQAGTHYFAISTLSSAGVESALSAVLSKTIL